MARYAGGALEGAPAFSFLGGWTAQAD